MSDSIVELKAIPLTKSRFADFGQVIELEGAQTISINQGLTTRFHDLFNVDTDEEGGRAIVNVFRTQPLTFPHKVSLMERHPLGSQAFIPTDQEPFLVLVAAAGDTVTSKDLQLFRTNGRQGVNFFKNTWHHFQIGTGGTRDFIVVDRGGEGNNLEEITVNDHVIITEKEVVLLTTPEDA
ncbi:MAG: ureidoglycolate lyase [Acidiferrobacterales bacterium]|nr:ureidoglycolate lyase [Acidiferrobacterales bacterium]